MGKEREKRGEREGKEKGIRGKIGVKCCKILKKGWKEEGKRKGDRDHASHAAISTLASQPTENRALCHEFGIPRASWGSPGTQEP